jgi:hypothetical protein
MRAYTAGSGAIIRLSSKVNEATTFVKPGGAPDAERR